MAVQFDRFLLAFQKIQSEIQIGIDVKELSQELKNTITAKTKSDKSGTSGKNSLLTDWFDLDSDVSKWTSEFGIDFPENTPAFKRFSALFIGSVKRLTSILFLCNG